MLQQGLVAPGSRRQRAPRSSSEEVMFELHKTHRSSSRSSRDNSRQQREQIERSTPGQQGQILGIKELCEWENKNKWDMRQWSEAKHGD